MTVRKELRQDSGGAGQWRGGLGVAVETRMLEAMDRYTRARRSVSGAGGAMSSFAIERTQCAPWGLFGGGDALANRVSVQRKDGSTELLHGKGGVDFLDAGDAIVMEAGGGGGFGDPLQRPAESVFADVRAGYVSLESARENYGVVVRKNGRGYHLDTAATSDLRARSSGARNSG
jgi:N-methylhydantoinase B